ncbi:nitrilase and fragile histidine triad fusion protein NitFhit [Danaus plexippus plexippus]|uniref:Nitrilase and fragile histidine triad fusion protein NitFhit n=1 Tax=Danaus plexippus plexippus TaxID=278856 RepID=A0A212EYD9_DANPL|nr:nitrilase and fragile histidine triad fusion protein NitFhit [Danaus plexippus plexippus]
MIRNFTLSILKNLHLESSQFSTMASRKLAVCQMTSVADKSANLNVVSQLISDAAKDDVKMLFFPECCDYICENKDETIRSAENLLTGETVKKYRELAATHNVWLSMGGLHEKDEASVDKIFNTHIIINDKGDIVQTYRKLHLFDVDIPERNIRLKESDFCNPGGHIVAPVDTPIGKIGLSICYDLRFPELSTSLSMMKAEILTYPSAFTYATGLAHWHILLRARAIENQCYVVAAAQTGQHNAKRRSFGHALVVDPWGEVLADCGDSAPCYKVVEITDRLQEVRKNMPVFQHRRPDVYSLYSLSIRNKPFNEPPPPPPRTPPLATTGNVFGHVSVPETCVFHKSELTYAFVNLRCVTPGHVLVAPIRLAERNKDLTDEEASDFFKTVRLIQNLMERVHNTESCTVTIQDGPDAGQTVKHLHCHIMPRKKGDFIENDLIYLELAKHDQMRSGHPAKPARSLEEMEAEAKYLREELKKMTETS